MSSALLTESRQWRIFLWIPITMSAFHAQVYVVGDVGIQEELDLKGINHIGGPADKDQVVDLKPGYALPHDHDVSTSKFLAC